MVIEPGQNTIIIRLSTATGRRVLPLLLVGGDGERRYELFDEVSFSERAELIRTIQQGTGPADQKYFTDQRKSKKNGDLSRTQYYRAHTCSRYKVASRCEIVLEAECGDSHGYRRRLLSSFSDPIELTLR